MKNIYLILLVFAVTTVNAQKLAKIRGSREVVKTEIDFEKVSSLEVNDNIQLNVIIASKETKLVILADDNLHEIVNTDLNEGKLNISLRNRISSKKKFELTLHINNLTEITLNDSSQLINFEPIEADDLIVTLNDRSKMYFLIESSNINVSVNDNAKAELVIETDYSRFELRENAKIKATVYAEKISIEAESKSIITADGTVNNANFITKNNATIKASNLLTEKAKLDTDHTSDVYVNTNEELEILARNRSKIYIYGKAKINLTEFKDTATLFKKE